MMTRCGAICDECPSFNTECAGCGPICGRVFWAKYIDKEICPVYQCCDDKKIKNCGECSELPCKMWFELKDPEMTDAQHKVSIDKRVERLRLQNE